MKLKRGPSRFWASVFRLGLLRPRMPFWRVVVEARLNRSQRKWPAHLEGAVTAVFVWARTIEEYGGLRSCSDRLADLDEWGLRTTRRLLESAPGSTPFSDDTVAAGLSESRVPVHAGALEEGRP